MAKRNNTILSAHSISLMLECTDTIQASSVLRARFIDDLATSVYSDLVKSGFDIAQTEAIYEMAEDLLGYDSTYDSALAVVIVESIRTATLCRFNALNK